MQDPASDISEKMTGNDNANIVKKPCSEDFVNNNKENDRDGKKWMLNPLRVSGNLFQDRRLSDERSNRESEDKTSDSEENDKSSPGPVVSPKGTVGLEMHLHTDSEGVFSGFKGRYQFMQAKNEFGDCGGNISNSENGVIKSPNYPEKYSSNDPSKCQL